jgi:mRNA-degrading endonuclease toxin of MazEF toxin-antitoxin module
MRVSVSIPARDVAFLDDYAERHSLPSRSAAFRAAIEALVASKAQAEHVRSVDVSRLHSQTGHLGPAELARVDAALRLHLAL